MHGDVDLAQMLIYAGANVRATTRLGGYTPLLSGEPATATAKMIETLLKAGADPKTTTPSGTTPLMLAAASGSVETP